MKNSTNSRLRASDLPKIISSDSKIRQSVQSTLQIYLFALMIRGYSKSLTNIGVLFGVSLVSLSRLVNHALLGDELDVAVSRRTRQIIATYINSHGHVTIDIIIDATVLERSSRKAENVGLYHSSGKKIWGHRITNVGILLDGNFYIPIAALVHKTKAFSRASGLSYLTEGMMVRRWLRNHMGGFISLLGVAGIRPDRITFLLDAGYDNADIQRDILKTGAHFVMMIRNLRLVDGINVKVLFTQHRCLAWVSIYFNKMRNGKNKRKKYRIRTVTNVTLHGVGKVNVVCSEKSCRSNTSKTRRFLVSSRLNHTGREIIECYAKRWVIETWHKDMKQNYGLNDCSCSAFMAIENHIKMCLIAYCMHQQGLVSLPIKGTTIEDYMQFSVRKYSRKVLSLINGSEKLNDEINERKDQIFLEAA